MNKKKTDRGRPKVKHPRNVRIQVVVSRPVLEAIDRLSRVTGQTRSGWVFEAIERELKRLTQRG
jgi:predicted DNA-binding protein